MLFVSIHAHNIAGIVSVASWRQILIWGTFVVYRNDWLIKLGIILGTFIIFVFIYISSMLYSLVSSSSINWLDTNKLLANTSCGKTFLDSSLKILIISYVFIHRAHIILQVKIFRKRLRNWGLILTANRLMSGRHNLTFNWQQFIY